MCKDFDRRKNRNKNAAHYVPFVYNLVLYTQNVFKWIHLNSIRINNRWIVILRSVNCKHTFMVCNVSFFWSPLTKKAVASILILFDDKSSSWRHLFLAKASPIALEPFSENPFQAKFSVFNELFLWKDEMIKLQKLSYMTRKEVGAWNVKFYGRIHRKAGMTHLLNSLQLLS